MRASLLTSAARTGRIAPAAAWCSMAGKASPTRLVQTAAGLISTAGCQSVGGDLNWARALGCEAVHCQSSLVAIVCCDPSANLIDASKTKPAALGCWPAFL